LLAQATSAQAPSPVLIDRPAPGQKNPNQLEEVIVTAQKKAENLMEVPVPVTALNAQQLVDQNLFELDDYYTRIPGLSVTPGDHRGDPLLTIRGITTGGEFSNPTVGIVIDDVPFGSSTGLGAGGPALDLDPSELV